MSVCTSLFVIANGSLMLSFFFAASVITPTGGRGEEFGEAIERNTCTCSAGCWGGRYEITSDDSDDELAGSDSSSACVDLVRIDSTHNVSYC